MSSQDLPKTGQGGLNLPIFSVRNVTKGNASPMALRIMAASPMAALNHYIERDVRQGEERVEVIPWIGNLYRVHTVPSYRLYEIEVRRLEGVQ